MKNIGFFMIFVLTFTKTNSIYSPCVDNPDCHCMSINLDQVKVICYTNSTAKYIINIKSRNNLQIFCKYWNGWEDFKFTSKLSRTNIDSLQFKNCGISNIISLKDVAEKLGVEKTDTLIFQSSVFLTETLNREHFEGFENVTKLDLSSNGLTVITKELFLDFPNLEWLDLSDNFLVLPNDTFDNIPNLKRIELCRNGLKIIYPRLFHKLKYLEYLHLMGNELTKLVDRVFDELESLKSLNLRGNRLTNISGTMFYGLKKLEILDISCNNFTTIPLDLFIRSTSLQKVFLQDNVNQITTLLPFLLSNLKKLTEVFLNRNRLIVLPESLFWTSTSIRRIVLSDNLLTTLPKYIFRSLHNVEHLAIDYNLIKTLPDGIFEDMISLDKLDLSNNRMIFITNDLFKGLRSLTELNMERNRIQHIENMALKSMILLRIAMFSYNQLLFGNISAQSTPFHYNRFLEELHLSHNYIQDFFSNWSISGYNLKFLDLSNNDIKYLSTDDLLIPLSKLEINLSYNKIKYISFKNDKKLQDYFMSASEIAILVDNNPFICDCYLYDLLRYRENKMSQFNNTYFKFELGELSCIHPHGTSKHQINELNSTTYICPEEEYFKIQGKCQIGCTCSVRPDDNTRILDCSNKKMSKLVIDPGKMNFVENYSLILNLTANALTEVPSMEHLQSINVTVLLLSNNRISQISLEKLPRSLRILELHNNIISTIDSGVSNYLNTRSLNEFTFSGNPVKCDCNIKDFALFVKSKRLYYKDLDNLKCENKNRHLYEMTDKELACPVNILSILEIPMLISLISIPLFIVWYCRKNIRRIVIKDEVVLTERIIPMIED